MKVVKSEADIEALFDMVYQWGRMGVVTTCYAPAFRQQLAKVIGASEESKSCKQCENNGVPQDVFSHYHDSGKSELEITSDITAEDLNQALASPSKEANLDKDTK